MSVLTVSQFGGGGKRDCNGIEKEGSGETQKHFSLADFVRRMTPSVLQKATERVLNSDSVSNAARSVRNVRTSAEDSFGRIINATTQPLRLIIPRGIADEIYETRAVRPMPPHCDIQRTIHSKIADTRGRPYARHVLVDGVYGVSFLSHHAVEVYEDAGRHYVVQWSMGSEASMSEEEKEAKAARVKEALKDHSKLKILFGEGSILVQNWNDFESSWNKARGGHANFQIRAYLRNYEYEEVIERLKRIMQWNFGESLYNCTKQIKTNYVRDFNEDMEYSITNNNCEHLAVYIFTGLHASKQTEYMTKAMFFTYRTRRNKNSEKPRFITSDIPPIFLPKERDAAVSHADIKSAGDAVEYRLGETDEAPETFYEELVEDEPGGAAEAAMFRHFGAYFHVE
jgi:hypothetical protein